MTPAEVVRLWISRFNDADVEGLVELYAPDAINDQVVFDEPMKGREAIGRMFEIEFGRAEMVCLEQRLHEAGSWAILEWKDPAGLRGCGFFHVQNDKIVEQRGYFDQLTFFKSQGLGIPDSYLESAD